jgi:hypothetical protein
MGLSGLYVDATSAIRQRALAMDHDPPDVPHTFTKVHVERDHRLRAFAGAPHELQTFAVQSRVGLDPLEVWSHGIVMHIEVEERTCTNRLRRVSTGYYVGEMSRTSPIIGLGDREPPMALKDLTDGVLSGSDGRCVASRSLTRGSSKG